MIERVPNIFQVPTNYEYPPHNKMIFEEYFMRYFIKNNIEAGCTYLPILWTNFYIGRKYGCSDMSDLQSYLNGLDRSKKYFTIIQYDDGILQDIDDLNMFIFGAGGGGEKTVSVRNLGYPIPLLCQPSPIINKDKKRDILCSFVGRFTEKYTIRNRIRTLFNDTFLIKDCIGYHSFIDIMERSVFSLCPRGYGATSFRICESLQHGSIPIYVYDTPWIPWIDEFDFNEIGILIHESKIPDILSIIQSKTGEDIRRYLERGKAVYEKYFTFDGCSKEIISKLLDGK